MKCPHCGLIVTDIMPECPGCNFTIAELDDVLPSPPARQGYINDFGKLLDKTQRSKLESKLENFANTNEGEIVLVTTSDTHPIKPSEYVFWLFNRWKIGGDLHRGAMILLSMSERRVESEIGYGWEHIITDEATGKILDKDVLPHMVNGNPYAALTAAAGLLIAILEGAPNETDQDATDSAQENIK